jgi:hypothetical protein
MRSNRTQKLIKKVEEMYYKKEMSSKEISDILGIHTSIILNILNNYLYGTRSYKEAAQVRRKNTNRYKMSEQHLENIRKGIKSRGFKNKWKEIISQANRGSKNKRAKLTEEQVLQIRQEYKLMIQKDDNKISAQNKLAYKFGVKRTTISDIVLRKKWKHV